MAELGGEVMVPDMKFIYAWGGKKGYEAEFWHRLKALKHLFSPKQLRIRDGCLFQLLIVP